MSSGWLVLPAKKQRQVTACLCLTSHSCVCVSILSEERESLAVPSALLTPTEETSGAGRMFVATGGELWGVCMLLCLKLRRMLSASRCGSGCSCFTGIQMHSPKNCNIEQKATARSVGGHRGLHRRDCFWDPQRADGWHLFIWENHSLHCQFSFFLAAKHPLSTPLFTSQGCQVLKLYPIYCPILHFGRVNMILMSSILKMRFVLRAQSGFIMAGPSK